MIVAVRGTRSISFLRSLIRSGKSCNDATRGYRGRNDARSRVIASPRYVSSLRGGKGGKAAERRRSAAVAPVGER